MTSPLSVILITKNEERNIAACLDSVAWAEEIILVDAESDDRTVELARGYTGRVFVEPWRGYAEAKSSALSRASREWVLWIDADERVTPELAQEIREIVSRNPSGIDAYRIARRSYFLGSRIRHCGWYPGYSMRLFRRGKARFSSARVHEGLIVEGRTEKCAHDFLHYTDETLEQYFGKYNSYTTLAAEELHAAGKRAKLGDLLLRPSFTFLKMYILRLGFLDGITGLILCALSASYVFTKYAKLWALGRKRADGREK